MVIYWNLLVDGSLALPEEIATRDPVGPGRDADVAAELLAALVCSLTTSFEFKALAPTQSYECYWKATAGDCPNGSVHTGYRGQICTTRIG